MFTLFGLIAGAVDRRPEPCWFHPNMPTAVRRTARINAGYAAGRILAGRA